MRRAFWTSAIVVVLVVAGSVGLSWYASSMILVPNHEKPAPSEVLLGTGTADGARTVLLAASKSTRQPGVRFLSWGGGAAMVGPVVSESNGRVERELLRGSPPPAGTQLAVKAKYPFDPSSLLNFDIEDVNVPTELGRAPALYAPADGPASSTWVIAVHGQNGYPATALNGVDVMHELGLPVLSVSYRNDVGAPAAPDGLMHLGGSEWRDVDAAIRTAREMGAERVVLAGSSMGGSIVGQTLVRSDQAVHVSAVVLDAPETDWERAGETFGARYGLPAPLTWLAGKTIEARAGIDFERLNLAEHPPRRKPPMLLIHSTPDEESPVRASRDFAHTAQRMDWPVQYEEFRHGAHTESWNLDRARYERLLADFLTRTALKR